MTKSLLVSTIRLMLCLAMLSVLCIGVSAMELNKVDAVLASQVSNAPARYASLSTTTQELWLEQKADGARVFAIVDTITHRNLLSTADQSIFQLELKLNNTKVGVRADYGWSKAKISSTANGLRISLSGQKEPGLETMQAMVTAKISADKSAILWRLKIFGVPQNASVLKVRFPEVALSVKTGYWNVLLPKFSGILASGPQLKGVDFSGEYPGGWCTMQWMTVYDRSSGFYFACQDPYGSYRIINAKGSADDVMKLSFEQFAPNMTVPGNGYESDYDTAWQVYKGDWYDASRIYKSWVSKNAKWYNRKGQARTPATPKAIEEISSWAQSGGSSEECVDAVIKFKEYMGVPTAFHWYTWHMNPFDNDYPHYFPTKPGIAEGVKKLKDAGVYVMPYINGRLWDTRDRGIEDFEWTSVAKPGTTKDENGVPYIESYGSKEADGSDVRLSIMCPSTAIWQNKMEEIVLRLMNEVGVNGVYMDQISAAAPKACMDKTHGHPLGGGHWWTESYWKLVQNIRNKMPKDHFLTSECNAEPYIRFFDAYLTWHWQDDGMVAAFPAIYGGTIGMFGRSYTGDTAAVRAKAAQQLVFGEQIGWCDPGIINDKPKGEYLRKAIRIRYAFRDVISKGEMLRPLSLSSNVAPITADWQWYGPQIVTTAPVLTGTWKKGKKVVFIFANVSEKPVSSKFRVNAGEYGIPNNTQAKIHGDESRPVGKMDLDLSREQTIDLAPTEIAAWECSASK